jgi:hypothetical protein
MLHAYLTGSDTPGSIVSLTVKKALTVWEKYEKHWGSEENQLGDHVAMKDNVMRAYQLWLAFRFFIPCSSGKHWGCRPAANGHRIDSWQAKAIRALYNPERTSHWSVQHHPLSSRIMLCPVALCLQPFDNCCTPIVVDKDMLAIEVVDETIALVIIQSLTS